MTTQRAGRDQADPLSFVPLKTLNLAQIKRIDEMLSELGPFGELRLIKKKGLLRFIERVESFDLVDEG